MKKRYLTPTKVAMLSVVVLVVISAVIPQWVMAQQKQLNPKMTDEEQIIPLPKQTVNIDRKMLEAVITATGERYKLSYETIIVGMNGDQVSIRDMLVPCEAKITYKVKQGQRIALRVKMLSTYSDSNRLLHSDGD